AQQGGKDPRAAPLTAGSPACATMDLPRNEEPSMRLHRILPALLGLLLATPAVQAEPRVEGRRISVDSADARAFIQERFPQRHSTLGGLLQLTVSNPGLELPPGARMHLGLDLAAATAGGA